LPKSLRPASTFRREAWFSAVSVPFGS